MACVVRVFLKSIDIRATFREKRVKKSEMERTAFSAVDPCSEEKDDEIQKFDFLFFSSTF
jgi:hypothetical protein